MQLYKLISIPIVLSFFVSISALNVNKADFEISDSSDEIEINKNAASEFISSRVKRSGLSIFSSAFSALSYTSEQYKENFNSAEARAEEQEERDQEREETRERGYERDPGTAKPRPHWNESTTPTVRFKISVPCLS